MTAKNARLMVRLDQADIDWIKEQGERLGLDAATFVRSLIRQHRNGIVSAPAASPAPAEYDQDDLAPEPIDIDAIDIDALAAPRQELFPAAMPGDVNAVRAVGSRASRGELLGTFSGRK